MRYDICKDPYLSKSFKVDFFSKFDQIDSMKKPTPTILISIILGSFFYIMIGWIIFDFILGPFTDAQTTQIIGFKKTTDFSYLFLYLSCFAYSALINFIFIHSKIESLNKSFSFSAIVGVLVACMTDFYWYASSNFYSSFTVIYLDIIGAAVTVGALGGFTFLLLNKSAKK